MKQDIRNIADRYTNRYGEIFEDDIWDYIDDLEKHISDRVEKLLKYHHCLEAFELVNEAYIEAENYELEYVDDAILDFLQRCYELWVTIMESADEEQQKAIIYEMKQAPEESGQAACRQRNKN